MKKATAERISDLALEKRMRELLQRCQMPGLRRIDIAAHQGVVTLSGRVNSFYERQLCIQCGRRCAGVAELQDEIQVEHAHSTERIERGRP